MSILLTPKEIQDARAQAARELEDELRRAATTDEKHYIRLQLQRLREAGNGS